MAKKLDSITPKSQPTDAPVIETVAPSNEVPGVASLTENESYESLFPEPTVTISSPPSWIWWVLLIIAAIVMGTLGYFVANGKVNQWLSVPATTPTPTATATITSTPGATPSIAAVATATPVTTATPIPTATPVASTSVTPSKISIRVLNGTSVAGAAASAANTLKQAGFNVTGVANAARNTYTSTIIYYQTGQSAAAAAVAQQLSSYKSTTTEDSALTNGNTVLVVLGPRS